MKAHWRKCPGERRYSDTNAQCVAGLVFQHGNCRDCFVCKGRGKIRVKPRRKHGKRN